MKLAGGKHILDGIFEKLVLVVMFYNASTANQSDQLTKTSGYAASEKKADFECIRNGIEINV